MNTPTHSVVVPFPQAFASLLWKRSPFPSAPRYGRSSLHQADRPPTVRWECALRKGSTPSIRQVAYAQVDTLVLLPRGTIYPGTQRNTIDLLNVQTIYRYILSQGSKSGNRRLRAWAFHPLLRKTGAFKPIFRKRIVVCHPQPTPPRSSSQARPEPLTVHDAGVLSD
jgi:hypothetical protein